MKISEYYHWIKTNWAKVGPILSLYLTIFLFVFVREADFVVFLILLQTPLYMLHETEEFVFPGGFSRFFNRDIFKVDKDDEPIGVNFSFYINIFLIWLILPFFGLLSLLSYQWGLWIVYFSLFAGIAHIALGLKAKKLYNPGLFVSLLLNIPVSLWMISYFVSHNIISSPFLNWHLVIGIAVNLVLPIMGSILIKKYRSTTKAS